MRGGDADVLQEPVVVEGAREVQALVVAREVAGVYPVLLHI